MKSSARTVNALRSQRGTSSHWLKAGATVLKIFNPNAPNAITEITEPIWRLTPLERPTAQHKPPFHSPRKSELHNKEMGGCLFPATRVAP
jgi:hypothetical protein